MASAASLSGEKRVVPAPPALRRLQWPRVAPVDLATELPWLILHESPAQEWATRASEEQDPDDARDAKPHNQTTTRSVYAQPLRAPPSPPPARSPAQRAARKMLKLQDEMDRRDEYARRQAAYAAVASSPNKPIVTERTHSPTRAVVPTKTTATKCRRPVEPSTPQAKLQQWLARQRPADPLTDPSTYSSEMESRIYYKMHVTLGSGLWTDQVASPIAAELSSESVFGGVVATRRLAFDASPDKPRPHLVADAPPPITTAATSIGSPSHDEQVDTCKPTHSQSPPPPSPARSTVQQFADDVRDEARALVAAGDVRDALATLQRGIERVLHDFQDNHDALRVHGFDYSSLAHAKAQSVQLAYRRRHRHRLQHLVRLQRVWRRTRARRAFLARRAWRATHATVVQRAYRQHLHQKRREHSAVRIQRCFRVYQSQKLLVWLHRACRVLTTDYRRQRELLVAKRKRRRRLWVRLVVLVTMLRFMFLHRLAAVHMQSQWRGYDARRKYANALARRTELETQRRRREDAFVASRLSAAREALRAFYSETTSGRTLVTWRLRAPWLRWRRLRHETPPPPRRAELARTLRAMYAQREGTENVQLRGLEAHAVASVLGLQRPTQGACVLFLDRRCPSTGESESVHPADTIPTVDPSWRISGVGSWLRRWPQRWIPGRTQWTSRRHAAARTLHAALWTLLWFPRLAVQTSFLFPTRRKRARETALAELLDAHERVLRVHLRRVYRSTQHETVHYACTWCGAAAATAKQYYAHRDGCDEHERLAQRERVAVEADAAYRNKRSIRHLVVQRHKKNRSSTAVVAAPRSLVVDGPLVRRVCGRWNKSRHRRALGHLVEAARTCGPADAVSSELVAQLVWLLDDASGSPLERIHTVTSQPQQLWSEEWLRVDDVRRALGLDPRPQPAPLWTRVRMRLRTALWTHPRGRIATRYHVHTRDAHQADTRGRSRMAWWRHGLLARVVAVA